MISLRIAFCNMYFLSCRTGQKIVFPLAMGCNILYYYEQDRRNGGKVNADLLQSGAS